MIELFRQADAGTIQLDAPIPITNQFSSIVDGSSYTLDVSDDSDKGEIYKRIGKTMTARELCEAMITVSSNLATNILIERLGVQNIQRTTAALGAADVKVLRGVEDNKAFAKGLNNTTTAHGLQILLDAIATGRAASPSSSREMLEILKRQTFNTGIPAGVPPGTAVAHKTGTITKIHHDAGIVFAPHPYVLVVLVRGIADEAKSATLIADVSRLFYEHVEGRSASTRP
jgi:beta-lactamase class A